MEIIIGKDIREYKVKDIGPLSLREAFFLILMLGTIYLSYFLQKKLFGTYISLFLYIPAIPWALLGFIKPCGLPFEKWAKTVFVEKFINPKIRLYESDKTYDINDFLTEEELTKYIEEESRKPVKVKLTEEQKKYLKGYK